MASRRRVASRIFRLRVDTAVPRRGRHGHGLAAPRERRRGPHPARPLAPKNLHIARTEAESRAINAVRGPAIIISSSGMATGGRILHHLAQRLPDPRNTVILVGFQAEGTRGRSLLEGAHAVKMLGRYVRVRANVVHVPAFSVHADATELLAWLRT